MSERFATFVGKVDPTVRRALLALARWAVPTEWTAPTFQNSWTNYGSGFRDAAYRKVGDRVELRGLVKNGTMSTAMFTLPEGHRPTGVEIFSTAAADAFGEVRIYNDGQVQFVIGSNTWVTLDGLSFSVS